MMKARSVPSWRKRMGGTSSPLSSSSTTTTTTPMSDPPSSWSVSSPLPPSRLSNSPLRQRKPVGYRDGGGLGRQWQKEEYNRGCVASNDNDGYNLYDTGIDDDDDDNDEYDDGYYDHHDELRGDGVGVSFPPPLPYSEPASIDTIMYAGAGAAPGAEVGVGQQKYAAAAAFVKSGSRIGGGCESSVAGDTVDTDIVLSLNGVGGGGGGGGGTQSTAAADCGVGVVGLGGPAAVVAIAAAASNLAAASFDYLTTARQMAANAAAGGAEPPLRTVASAECAGSGRGAGRWVAGEKGKGGGGGGKVSRTIGGFVCREEYGKNYNEKGKDDEVECGGVNFAPAFGREDELNLDSVTGGNVSEVGNVGWDTRDLQSPTPVTGRRFRSTTSRARTRDGVSREKDETTEAEAEAEAAVGTDSKQQLQQQQRQRKRRPWSRREAQGPSRTSGQQIVPSDKSLFCDDSTNGGSSHGGGGEGVCVVVPSSAASAASSDVWRSVDEGRGGAVGDEEGRERVELDPMLSHLSRTFDQDEKDGQGEQQWHEKWLRQGGREQQQQKKQQQQKQKQRRVRDEEGKTHGNSSKNNDHAIPGLAMTNSSFSTVGECETSVHSSPSVGGCQSLPSTQFSLFMDHFEAEAVLEDEAEDVLRLSRLDARVGSGEGGSGVLLSDEDDIESVDSSPFSDDCNDGGGESNNMGEGDRGSVADGSSRCESVDTAKLAGGTGPVCGAGGFAACSMGRSWGKGIRVLRKGRGFGGGGGGGGGERKKKNVRSKKDSFGGGCRGELPSLASLLLAGDDGMADELLALALSGDGDRKKKSSRSVSKSWCGGSPVHGPVSPMRTTELRVSNRGREGGVDDRSNAVGGGRGGGVGVVRFAYPPVTSVHNRPRTSSSDIDNLFFTEEEMERIRSDRRSRRELGEGDIECIMEGMNLPSYGEFLDGTGEYEGEMDQVGGEEIVWGNENSRPPIYPGARTPTPPPYLLSKKSPRRHASSDTASSPSFSSSSGASTFSSGSRTTLSSTVDRDKGTRNTDGVDKSGKSSPSNEHVDMREDDIIQLAERWKRFGDERRNGARTKRKKEKKKSKTTPIKVIMEPSPLVRMDAYKSESESEDISMAEI